MQPVIVGFGSDEGVRRNQGRIGAAHAPEGIAPCARGFAGQIGDGGHLPTQATWCRDEATSKPRKWNWPKCWAKYWRAVARPLVFGGGRWSMWVRIGSGLRLHQQRETDNAATPLALRGC